MEEDKKKENDKIEGQVEDLLKKIASIRIERCYSLENVADDLGITPAAYRKVEIGETSLSVERLFRIVGILKTSLAELLEVGNEIFQQTNTENSTGYQQKIEHFYQENNELKKENNELTDNLISALQSQITHLEDENKFYRSKFAEGVYNP